MAIWVLSGVLVGALLFLLREWIRDRRSGDAAAVRSGECAGRWACLDSQGVREVVVRWDPVIAHYLLDGEVWVNDQELADFLSAMEGLGAGAWIPARDSATGAIRRGLGLPELSDEGVRG